MNKVVVICDVQSKVYSNLVETAPGGVLDFPKLVAPVAPGLVMEKQASPNAALDQACAARVLTHEWWGAELLQEGGRIPEKE